MFAEGEFHPFNLMLDLLLRYFVFAVSDSQMRQNTILKQLDTQVYRSEYHVERLSTHIGIRTDQVTYNVCSVSINPISTPILVPIRLTLPINPSIPTPEKNVPDPHCNHLNLELPIYLRQCHRSLQEEN